MAMSLEVCVACRSARSPTGLPRCFGDLPWPRALLLGCGLSVSAFTTGFESPTFPFAKHPLAPVRGVQSETSPSTPPLCLWVGIRPQLEPSPVPR